MDNGVKMAGASMGEVQEEFTRWRKERGKKGRIPNELWQLATEVAQKHGVQKTSATLRLNSTALRDRMEMCREVDAPKSDGMPAFVELTGAAEMRIAPRWVVELCRPAGAKMRLEFSGPSPDVCGMIRAFCESGAG